MTDQTQTLDSYIRTYIQTRNKVKELKDKHTEELKPYVDLHNSLTEWLLLYLEKMGPDAAAKTRHGTAYSSVKYSASLTDPDAFMKYAIANDRLDLVDRRANANAVRDFVAEKDTLPPGVKLSSMRTVGVRSPT